ncbi:SusD/RagB family nutrient-binding outer membrane lipoprotein [Neotamlana laminarinivorans]|uniref:SusD/RagB family nutrient-binding outer membrane lipoprotein n=1 Tax=Neotamlana laminarinivorans TaxID=2883124 RepID=A0A9X1I0M4_9FLAO|nr:SusD/RagB family nutrient-binding outer membrane lipoprotein [Tamlana laminarinivorans]MCB4799240.1 SusD/RagB family nutrient-binding outer membrane lipoprotein [Tamlana laminarinivorans]
MRKIFKKHTILAILLSVTLACENYTDNYNQDPNAFGNAAPELVIGQAQLAWILLSSSNSARYAGIFMNQFTGSDRQYITVNSYSVTASEFDDMWDDAYVDGIAQADITVDAALENENLKLAGVALITKAVLLAEVAALWGDVPFTEANDADQFYTPAYDSQSAVFAGVQDLLDTAIDYVEDEPASLYAGNRLSSTATWAEIAHSLKARYYLITKEYDLALTEAQNGISTLDGSLVSLHTSSTLSENLYYQFIVDQRDGYLTADNSYLFQLLDSTDNVDRLLETPGDTERAAYYFSESGGTDVLNTTDGVFAETSSFNLISYYETKLIEAEAAIREGQTTIAQDALNSVRDELALEYDAMFPQTTSTGDTLLQEILEEKYITLIGELQPYHDIRRTNNLLGVPAKTGTEIPQRFLYPQNEIDTNPNVPSPLPGLYDVTEVNQ